MNYDFLCTLFFIRKNKSPLCFDELFNIIKKKIYIWLSSMIMIYDYLFATISASIKIDTVILYGKCKYVQYANTDCGVFKRGGIKLERFLPKNKYTQRKFLNFENWVNGEVSKSAKSPNLLTFKVNFLYQKLSESFSIFFSLKNINCTFFVFEMF